MSDWTGGIEQAGHPVRAMARRTESSVGVVIACRHIPGAQGVATVVSGDGVPDGDEREDDDGR